MSDPMKAFPRRLAMSLLRRLLPASQQEGMLGDLDEEYVSIQVPLLGGRRAGWWYCREAIVALAFAALESGRLVSRKRSEIVNEEHQNRTTLMTMVANAGAFIMFWLIAFVLVQFAERVLHGWPASALMEVTGCAVGVVIALRLRARFTALLLVGQFAFLCSELVLHAIYGIRAVQGAPTHFAVMGAGTLGVLLGVFLVPHLTGRAGQPPVTPLESESSVALTGIRTDAAVPI
jgi:hypothetical protein